VLGLVVLVTVVTVLFNLLVDLAYAAAGPQDSLLNILLSSAFYIRLEANLT
jgi:hypothetical protein